MAVKVAAVMVMMAGKAAFVGEESSETPLLPPKNKIGHLYVQLPKGPILEQKVDEE